MLQDKLSNAQLKQFLIDAKSRDIHFTLVDGRLKSQAAQGAITPADRQVVKSHKDEIMEILAATSFVAKEKIQVRPDGDNSLSFAQQRLWFVDSLQGGSAQYNMPMVFDVKGQLNTELMTKVFNTILERHEVLRTVYVDDEGETRLQITDMVDAAFEITVEDLSHLQGEALTSEVNTLVEAGIVGLFNLSSDLMLRVTYVKKSNDTGVLIFNMHHIASDGWSMQVLTKEFFALYSAYNTGQDSPLPPLAIQYADYAHWQREYLSGEMLQSQLSYWEKQLDELPAVHSLPLDFERPKVKKHKGAMVTGTLPASTAKSLLDMAKAHQLTPFMLLHGALSLLLSRHSNSHDIVIGTPVANRLQAELEPLIGFFVNTLVLRVDTRHASLSDYFSHIRRLHLDGQSNQDVPFEQLVERLKAPRSTAHSPLYQIMMLTNTDYGVNKDGSNNSFSLPGAQIKPCDLDFVQEKFDLSVVLDISEQGMGLSWSYDVSLFSETHIEQLNQHLCRLLQRLGEAHGQPTQAPNALEMLSQTEVQRLLFDLNDTQVDYPKDQCIHRLFEQQAAQNPDNVAVFFDQEGNEGTQLTSQQLTSQQLTYRQLNEKANQLAHYLQQNHNVKADTLVGLCTERSLEMVIGIMGILKAGGAYVPLDPGYPRDRLNYMLEDSGLAVVLSQTPQQDLLSEFNGTVLMLDGLGNVNVDENSEAHFCAQCDNSNPPSVDSSNLAYMIYTSGSTGKPKGVMVEHQALFNRIHWMNNKYGMSADDKVLQKTPYSFDVSVWEFVWTLAYGAQLVVARPDGHKDPEYMCQIIQRQKITKLHFVPSMLGVILAMDEFKNSSCIEQVFCSGEALQQGHVQGFRAALPDAQLHNLYGPTEAAIDVSYWDCSGDISQGVPIGKPIDNIQLVILDSNLNVVPEGAVGELHIGGDGLARGYHNRDELTAQTFINNPFYDTSKVNSSKRLYKTGDLARLRADGEIEYQGRTDHQVKIRGLRIELGEIEHQLGGLALVDSALVLATELSGAMQLVGYVKSTEAVDEELVAEFVISLKQTLGQTLPSHMVPDIIMVLNEWPLTPNGKVDRKALPAPDGSSLQGEYIAPNTPIEQALVDIWADLLNIDAQTISTKANFFALGGHSLIGLKVVTRLRAAGLGLTINDIFEHYELSELAKSVTSATAFTGSKSLIAADCSYITPELLDLVELTQTELDLLMDKVPGGAANIQDIYPMSPLQQGIFYQSLVQQEIDHYITFHIFNIDSEQTYQTFTKAIEYLVSQHDILRTSFHWEQLSQPVQVVGRQASVPINRLDDSVDAQQVIKARLESRTFRFNIQKAPLLNLTVCKQANTQTYVIGIEFHHLVDDNIAIGIFLNQLAQCMQGNWVTVPVELQYRNYIQRIAETPLEQAQAFFGESLSNVPELSNIFDVAQQTDIDVETQAIDVEKLNQLKIAAKKHQVGLPTLMHVAWSMVVGMTSGKNNVVFGTVLSGRMGNMSGLEEMVGPLINTLPLAVSLDEQSLGEVFSSVEAALKQLVKFEYTPLPMAIECCDFQVVGELFNSIVNYRYAAGDEPEIDNVKGTQSSELVHYPFALNVDDRNTSLHMTVFAPSSIGTGRMLDYLGSALDAIIKYSDAGQDSAASQSTTMAQVLSGVLPEQEKQHLLYDLNETQMDYAKQTCIHQLFEQQALDNPDNVALFFAGEGVDGKQLTYQQLNEKANQLAHYLQQKHGVKADTLVGLCVERSLEMVIGLVAILKAGGAYVPLDPSYPQERLSYMLEDAALNVVLCQTQVASLLSNANGTAANIVTLDGLGTTNDHFCASFDKSNPATTDTPLTSSNLAYMIYTSGSTGKPKGVMVEHQALFNRIHWMHNKYGMSSDDKVLQKTPFSFDVSVWEFVWTLAYGAQLVMAQPEGHKDPEYLCKIIEQQQITKLHFVPSMLGVILETEEFKHCDSIKQVFCSGEALQQGHVQGFRAALPAAQIHNLYGPTEAAIDVSYFDCSQDIGQGVPIGKPIDNIQLVILDSHLNVVPKGAVGELHIGGDGLARGYLNRDELNAQVFITNPYYDASKPNSSKRLYKTGDLARLRQDGEIEYQGRTDHQVKIRGLRIELGEIEHQLGCLASVDSALVLAQELAGAMQLIGYVKSTQTIAQENVADFVTVLKTALAQNLPAHMVPG
ncbi:MAG: amino acid adenylation domain-containing protein, partial [Algicola sp.]|nr:amino acid adenylation domain-containing protein [Algicola sp.]